MVRKFFNQHIFGLALMAAAKKAGLNFYHNNIGRVLQNEKYLGDDYYPAIIDRETFDKAEKVQMSRAKVLGV